MMRLTVLLLLASAAQAFNAPQPRSSGVVRNVIQSKWTMMPDEPAPEVRFLLLLLLLPRVPASRQLFIILW
jgi:hypothetical protein